MSKRIRVLATACVAGMAASTFAQESRGINVKGVKISPYVNLSVWYDSNVDSADAKHGDVVYSATPGVDISYAGSDWGFKGNAWYAYDLYQRYSAKNAQRYGERFSLYKEHESGWRLEIGEGYIHSSQDDSILDGGSGYWRDRSQVDFNALLTYEFSERFSTTLKAMYTWLDYKEQGNYVEYAGDLYGYYEFMGGVEFAYRLTEKSNLLLDINGQYYESQANDVATISSHSWGYNVQGGFGSRLTERIRYRMLGGIQYYEYADDNGLWMPSYSADMSWVFAKRWAATVAGSSFFQPSEQTLSQSRRVYTLSAGLTYKPFNRLSTGLDIAYRHEDNKTIEGYENYSEDYETDQAAARFRVSYALQRYVTLTGSIEYTKQFSDQEYEEWDRFRSILGVNFRY